MLEFFSGTELFEKMVGNVSLCMDLVVKQILFMAQLYIYLSIYNSTKEYNEKAQKMITKASFKMRYRSNTITMTGQIVRFITDTMVIVITLGFVLISKFIVIESYHVVLLANVCNTVQSIALFFSCPELTRKYFGEFDQWMPKFVLKLLEPKL